ncbi:MAG: SDR family oxidoreductase [Burkholderiales bacterium]|nr:SDR family oxidoreductase [Burkholderiales bacterium]
MQLKDKVAIITGAASGFGEAIAQRFAAEGAKVIVDDINAAGGERVAEEIRKAGGTAQFVKADVTRGADWAALVATTQAKFGRLDIVVNNAGWTHRNKPFMDVTEEEYDHVYATNVKSIYLSALHALPVFRAQGGGCFVNVASTAGVRPRPGLTVYNSSKGAVILLSKSMAAEFGPDQIRVNCVNPVFCPDTGLSAEFAGGQITTEVRAKFSATVPMGRLSTVRDIANATLFLASDEAAFINGTCLEVDGGRCC